MSTISVQHTTVIDTIASLHDILEGFRNLAVDPPSIYFAIKDVQRGITCSVGLLYIHLAPQACTYAINIRILGASAFSTTDQQGTSLKSIFESKEIPKVCFDIREASHALHSSYEVKVGGIIDLQLLELAKRKTSKTYVAGLKKCIERDHPAGSLQASVPYVEYLPGLWKAYSSVLRLPALGFWRQMVREAVAKRIKGSQSDQYSRESDSGAREPLFESDKIEEERDAWNDEVLSSTFEEIDLDVNDKWVPISDIRRRGPYPVAKSSVLTLAAPV